MTAIQMRLEETRRRIELAAGRAGKLAPRLLVISKSRPASLIREAWQAGQRAFGENYVLEGLEKIRQLQDLADLEWHFTGRLQSNKARHVAEHFDWIHSVDRLKTAQRLSVLRPDSLPPLNLCIQVNIDSQATKGGVHPDALLPLAQQLVRLPQIRLRGLMAIPAPPDQPDQQRHIFRTMKQLFDQLRTQLQEPQLDTLSMGMSADMELAVEEGSTLVRIGTAIMGPAQASSA